MSILTNSSGKVLKNSSGSPYVGSSSPSSSTITITDEGLSGYYEYYDLVNNIATPYATNTSIVISGHIGDIIRCVLLDLDFYEYSGLITLNSTISSVDAIFRVNSSTASITYTCFTSGTQITMSNNTYKNIEDIIVGDRLLGYNGNEYVEIEVLRTFKHKFSGTIYKVNFNNGYFEATGNHPIYINGEYKKVNTLQIGDNLLCNGINTPITSIETREVKDIYVYNLDTSDTNNYIVNNCLAHNKPA